MEKSPKRQVFDTDQDIYKTIVNNSGGGIYIVQNNRIVFHNPQFSKLTGYSSYELNKMDFPELVHQKDKKLINILFSNNFREISKKKSRSYTFRALHKNGEMRWFKSNVSLISWEGQPALLDNCFDITQQKETERNLIEEEQNFRLLVNGFEDMVFIISKRGAVVQANRSVYNRLGLSEHQVVLKNFSAFFSEEFRDTAKRVVSDAFFGKRVLFTSSFLRGNNSTIPIETRLFKGNWSQKEVVFAICQDISVRIEAERIIKLSEEKFSKAFENNAVMMLICSFDEGRFIDVNETFLNVTGLSRNQVIGFTSQEVNVFSDTALFDKLKMLILLEGRTRDAETRIVSISGNDVICNLSAELIDIQGEDCFLLVLGDVTEQKRAQEKILLSEQRFRQLAELLPEKIFEADSNGYLTFANNYLQSYVGIDPSKLSKGIHITDLFAKKSQKIINNYMKHRNNCYELPSVELTAQKEDGSNFPALTHIIAVVEGNSVGRYMGVMVDITARKIQETELIKAKNLAEEASRAKERFLSTMSHEIRTPMNAVIGMANILLQDKPLGHQIEYLQTLKFSAEGLMVLLNDILDFSKIEAGKLAISNSPCNLKDLAQGVFNTYNHIVQKKDLDMKLEFDNTLTGNVLGDIGRLNQILGNLISNAIKFTDKGSVKITLKKVKETTKSVWVLFSVADTGIGIPLEKQKIIFQEFTQANPHTTRNYGGTGLGLAISKKLVKMLNGDLKVISQPKEGSEFFFTLPFQKANDITKKQLEIPDFPIPQKSSGKPYRILVVEDNEINSFIAIKFLNDWDLETQLAENGAIAVDLIKNDSFDLVIMDLEMPVMSGYEATRIIRQMPDNHKSKIPIIALTASAMLDVQAKIFSLGMNGFILKPFSPTDLKAKVSELLQLA